MGPGRDRTHNPWICILKKICLSKPAYNFDPCSTVLQVDTMPRTKMAARKAGAATRAAAKTTTNVSVEVETEAGVDDTEMADVTDEVEQVDAAKDEEGKTVEVNGDAKTKETEDGTTGTGKGILAQLKIN